MSWRLQEVARNRWILGTALMSAFWGGSSLPSQAQDSGVGTPPEASASGQMPTLVIESDPVGAVVTLHGPYEWVGQTPWKVYREMSGLYRAEARLPGYETWKGEVVLGPGGVQELTIRLSRKTAFKAAGRSLFVPGWGQFYRDSPTKGTLFLAAAVGAAGGLLWTHEVYQNRVDDFDEAVGRYRAATRQEDLAPLRLRAEDASRKADRAYDRRQIFLGLTAGVYAVSLLDALLFPPAGDADVYATAGETSTNSNRTNLGWKVDAAPDGSLRAGLSLGWR